MLEPPAPAGGPGVLVVSGGGFQGLAAVAALRELPGVRIVVADALAHPLAVGLANECVRVPPVAAGAPFVDALVALCERERLELLVPCTAHELPLLAASRRRFETRGCRVAVSDAALLPRLLDKRACAALLRQAGVPALEEVDPDAADAPYPLVAKPRWSWGGRGQLVLWERLEWQAQGGSRPGSETHVFQAWLQGWDELSVDFAIDFDGRVSPLLARRRLRVSGGFAVASETDADAQVVAVVERFAQHAAGLGGRGLFNVQVLRREGELRVIDVNPRLGTSATHWLGSGASLMRHLLGIGQRAIAPALPAAGLRRRSLRRLCDVACELDAEADAAERRLRGLVFDLDDTLVPHKRWMLARLEALAATEPLVARIGRERLLGEALRLIEEGRAPELFDALQGSLGLSALERRRLLESYRGCVPTRCDVYDDVEAALATLRRRGYRLALLSDNPPEGQRSKLRASGLEGWFDVVVFSREVGAEKPAATGFRAVEAALGLPRNELGMVGDNPYRDVAGALACGWGFAYLIRRPGSMYAFDHELYRRCLGRATHLRVVQTLSELLPETR